jgi:hypothetical protein
VYAAAIAKAKTIRCSGCGERFPTRETFEVGPEHVVHGHELQEGEWFCSPCEHRRGIL